MIKFSSKNIAAGGLIAALYVVITMIATALGLSSGVIQFRISEALCILPMFTTAAIPGLTLGCLIANILAGGVFGDVIFGAVATLIGAVGTRLLRGNRWLAPLCPVISNMVIVPFILIYAYHVRDAYFYLLFTVGVGELVCAYVLGQVLYTILKKRNILDRLTTGEK